MPFVQRFVSHKNALACMYLVQRPKKTIKLSPTNPKLSTYALFSVQSVYVPYQYIYAYGHM